MIAPAKDVLPSDKQLSCPHTVGYIISKHRAILLWAAESDLMEDKYLVSEAFQFCPTCGIKLEEVRQ